MLIYTLIAASASDTILTKGGHLGRNYESIIVFAGRVRGCGLEDHDPVTAALKETDEMRV